MNQEAALPSTWMGLDLETGGMFVAAGMLIAGALSTEGPSTLHRLQHDSEFLEGASELAVFLFVECAIKERSGSPTTIDDLRRICAALVGYDKANP